MLDIEIVPSGAIVLTIARRNEDTGGTLQHETVAFRLNDTVEAVTLTPEEARDAEAAVAEREAQKAFDFSTVSSPLAARVASPWHSDIVLQEDIVFEDEGHGTVVGVLGHAGDMWIAHATGVVLHVVDGVVAERVDLGLACTHAIGFPKDFKSVAPS